MSDAGKRNDWREIAAALETYENRQMAGHTVKDAFCAAIDAYTRERNTAADRIANAPRAWARKYAPGDFRVIHGVSSEQDAKEFAACYGFDIARIALVELKEGE
jgi:hypothetical protein